MIGRICCFVTAAMIAHALTGCAIKPLPQDFSGINTYRIVQRIRCEVRDEVRSNIFQFIRTTKNYRYKDLAEKLHNGTIDFDTIPRNFFDEDTRKVLNRYDGAVVTYDFTFDITENNSNSLSLDVTRPLARVMGTQKLGGFSAGANFTRENQRLLRAHDSFAELLSKKYPPRFCLDEAEGPNAIYPITGRINVQDQVFTFLSLNQSGNLDATKDTGTAPALSDNIKFTTKLNGGASPSFSIMPLSHSFAVSGATLGFTAYREDIHQVIIVFSLPLAGISRQDRFNAKTILEVREREESLVQRARNVELLSDVSRIAKQLQ